MPHPDPTTRLYRACHPDEPVAPSDERYVVCDEARGGNVVESFEYDLRLADPAQPEVKLFAGHRGVGKTSELFRLRDLLERPPSVNRPSSFEVIYFDVSKLLDVNDLDFPDLLVCTAAEIQRQLREAQISGFGNVTLYLQRLWDDIKGALGSKILVNESEVDVPFGTLTVELKNRPNARKDLREEIEKRNTSLLDAVNDLLTTATANLVQAGRDGLVLIIDGLDKLVLRDLDDGRTNTHERLFIDRSDQLASLKAHTIYTVPISLIYSRRCADLEQTFGEHNIPVSMINLRGSGRTDPTPETTGMKAMWAMIEARCRYAGVTISDVFDRPETGQYLCRMTGGHPRHLMMLLRSAIGAFKQLPITREAAERAVSHYANSLFREIPDRFWEPLRAFAVPRDDIPRDEDHLEMLLLLHIFEYMNGRPWYEVNPVLPTLPKYGAGR